MMLELVVARYKENIDWIKNIDHRIKISIYNKFYQENLTLTNVGREAHTYLNHIINQYDNLSDYTVFCQGDPVFHHKDFVQKINDFYNYPQSQPLYFGPLIHENVNSIRAPQHPHGLPIYYFIELLFGKKCHPSTTIAFHAGAQFIIPKYNILNRPLNFYKFLHKFVSYDSESLEPWIFERLWPIIFDPNITISLKYELFI